MSSAAARRDGGGEATDADLDVGGEHRVHQFLQACRHVPTQPAFAAADAFLHRDGENDRDPALPLGELRSRD